jgi:hypothetical protein
MELKSWSNERTNTAIVSGSTTPVSLPDSLTAKLHLGIDQWAARWFDAKSKFESQGTGAASRWGGQSCHLPYGEYRYRRVDCEGNAQASHPLCLLSRKRALRVNSPGEFSNGGNFCGFPGARSS